MVNFGEDVVNVHGPFDVGTPRHVFAWAATVAGSSSRMKRGGLGLEPTQGLLTEADGPS